MFNLPPDWSQAPVNGVQPTLPAACVGTCQDTLLDNLDGQLARATGQTTETGRYLDTEGDLEDR